MTETEDIFRSLAASHVESVAQVEELAQATMATIFTSLLPPILGKQDIITSLNKYKKVCVRIEKRLAFLTLITDYVVAAIANPLIIDIFQLDTTNRSKQYIMDILSREWVSLFQAIITSLPMYKPSKEVMESTLSFLRRMTHHLLGCCDQRFSSQVLSPVVTQCLWGYGLQAVDGKEAPVKAAVPLMKQVFHSAEIDELDEIFGPANDDCTPSSKPAVGSGDGVSLAPSPAFTPSVGVRRLHVASLQLKCGVEQQITCQLEEEGIVLIITTRSGHCSKVLLGVREISAMVLSLTGDQTIFIYLTVAGCLAVQDSFSKLPDMSLPPLALLGGENRRLVIFVKKVEKAELTILENSLRSVVGEKLALVSQNVGKKLLAKTMEHGKLFSVPSKEEREDAKVRYGDRVGRKTEKVEDDKISLVNRGDVLDKEGGFAFNYWADPALLLNTSAGQSTRQPAMHSSPIPIATQTSSSTLLSIQISKPTLITTQISKPTLITTQISSPIPRSCLPKCTCSPNTHSCTFCRTLPSKSISQPALQGLDIALIIAEKKEEFFKVNVDTMQSKLPGKEALQVKYLEMKWEELGEVVKKRNADENVDETQAKRPRVNLIKHLTSHPTECDGVASANIQSPDPSSVSPSKSSNKSVATLSLASITSTAITPTEKCMCDDCVYVTKSHMERTKGPMNKCKCHPCVLRRKQIAEQIAKPWELVTMRDYEGDNYWLEPWVEDLFRDIKQKRLTVKQVAALTGTSYGVVYRQYKDRQAKLRL